MRWQATGMMVATLACAMHAGAQEVFDPGASHKWYLESYLDRSHDVRIASTDAVLR